MGTVSHSPRVPILENLVFGNKHFALSWFLLHRSQTYTTKYCRICLLLGKDDIISLFVIVDESTSEEEQLRESLEKKWVKRINLPQLTIFLSVS